MDNKSLMCFRRVAEMEHMTKAAKELYMSQSQLSRIISELETEMGAPLFDRTGRNIKLNAAGRVFYEYAMKIMTDYEDARAAVRSVIQREMFQVSFGTNVGAYTIKLLTELICEMPDVRVRDTSAPRHALTSMLRDGRIDFAITCPTINEIGMTSEVLFNEMPCVVYPEGHWLQGRETVSLQELRSETLVGVPHGYGARDAMAPYYNELGIDNHFAVETGNTPMVEEYVKNGIGIAIVPKSLSLLSSYCRSHLVDIEEDIPCPICITHMTDREPTEQQMRFYELTRAYFPKEFGSLS